MLLQFDQVTVSSRSRTLVDAVSLKVEPGEWVALVGQSGSGKSLLSRSAGKLLPSNLSVTGEIRFGEQNLLKLGARDMKALLGSRLSYVFQDYVGSFAPFKTVGRHFAEVIATHDRGNAANAKERTIAALESVGLDGSFASRYPFQISGGQLQRASIALALLFSPEILIADEVTTALDSVTGQRILSLLEQKRRETGCAILFITHDWRHVRRHGDRIAVMKEGKIVEAGGKHRVLDHPRHDYTKQLIEAAPVLDRRLPSGLREAAL